MFCCYVLLLSDQMLLIGQILMPLIIFGGLFINLSDIPTYFVWYSIFSFIQYGKKC